MDDAQNCDCYTTHEDWAFWDVSFRSLVDKHAKYVRTSSRFRCWGGGEVIPSTQHYYRKFFTIYYYLNCCKFRSYDHRQAEIYLLGFPRLATDPLFLEYS
jgi:hypothetical protein